MIFSHRLLRYATPGLHAARARRQRRARRRRRRRALRGHARAAARAAARRAARRRAARPPAADRPLLRAHHRLARRRAVGLAAPRHRPPGGTPPRAPTMIRPRRVDIVVSRASLLVLSRARAARRAMLAIRLESRGAAIYRQRRVGLDGEPFDVLKLRTMVDGAEHIGAGLAVNANDSRITRVGALPAAHLARRAAQPAQRAARRDVARSARARRCRRRSPSTPSASAGAWRSSPASPAGRRSTAAPRCPGRERIELDLYYIEHRSLAARPADPRAHARARARRRRPVQGPGRRLGGRAVSPAAASLLTGVGQAL